MHDPFEELTSPIQDDQDEAAYWEAEQRRHDYGEYVERMARAHADEGDNDQEEED